MPVVALTIAGAAKEFKAGSLHISQTANGRTTASFTVLSTDGSYRPAIGAEVIITEDGTRIFGGLVDKPRELGLLPGHTAIQTQVSAVDFHTYTDWRYINAEIPSQTLKTTLQTLTTYLDDEYGVTLHGSQVDGPTLAELKWSYRTLTEALNELATMTAKFGEPYVWRIDHFKVLRMYQPTTSAAPFNISGASLPIANVVGDIEVEPTHEHYANRVVVVVPPTTELNRYETFTGDGTTSTFTLQYTPTSFRLVTRNSNIYETVTTTEFTGSAYWTYDATANTITRRDGPPANGDTIAFNFDGTFSGVGVAVDNPGIATFKLKEKVLILDTIPSNETAQERADAELAKRIVTSKRIRYKTFDAGLIPGQTQTIDVSRRNLNVTAVITDVVTRDIGKTSLIRDVTAMVDGDTNLDKGWRDVYKQWSTDKTGSTIPTTTTVGTAPTAQAAPGAPDQSVQFNDAGRFGGDDAFLYYKDQNSLVCGGGGSSITAADFESCQVFGYNNHIGPAA